MRKFWKDFKAFISRGNVVDMAVGVAVASAFTAIVTAFTKGFISPLLALLSKDASLADLKWVLRNTVYEALAGGTTETVELAKGYLEGAPVVVTSEVAILWGAFLQAIIDFLIVALALFIVLRVYTSLSNKAAKMAEEAKKAAHAEEIAAAEEKAKAEAEAKAAADAAAAAAAAEEAAKAAAAVKEEKDRLVREEALLAEIRDLLKNK